MDYKEDPFGNVKTCNSIDYDYVKFKFSGFWTGVHDKALYNAQLCYEKKGMYTENVNKSLDTNNKVGW